MVKAMEHRVLPHSQSTIPVEYPGFIPRPREFISELTFLDYKIVPSSMSKLNARFIDIY